MNATGTGWTWDPSYDYLKQACLESLNRLETPYLDLYYVHGGTMDDDIDASIRAMEDLKAEGKIKEYGLSSLRPNVIEYWLEHSNFSYLMTPYSLLDRRIEELLPRLKDKTSRFQRLHCKQSINRSISSFQVRQACRNFKQTSKR